MSRVQSASLRLVVRALPIDFLTKSAYQDNRLARVSSQISDTRVAP